MSAIQTVEQIADLNTEAARLTASPDVPLDDYAAGLLLRNLTVLTDHLSPGQFRGLKPENVDVVLDVAAAANELAPLNGNVQRKPDETDDQYEYRLSVLEPLHSFQNKVSSGEYDQAGEEEKAKVKAVVRLGGKAFASVIKNADDYPSISSNETFFRENAEAAARRLEKSGS